MRWVGQGLVWLTLFVGFGCSRENPGFILATAGAAASESTGAGTTSGASSQAESGSADSSAGDSGPAGTTTSTSTTGPLDSTSTSTSTSTTTGAMDSSSGDPGSSTGSSTGEPPENVLYDLHAMCPEAAWTDAAVNPIKCQAILDPPPSVTLADKFEGVAQKVITVVPIQEAMAFVEGQYLVGLADAVQPRLRSELAFPKGGDPNDKITGRVYIEILNELVYSSEGFQLSPGQKVNIDLDLSGKPMSANEVKLILQLTVDAAAIQSSRGVWLNPRIIDAP